MSMDLREFFEGEQDHEPGRTQPRQDVGDSLPERLNNPGALRPPANMEQFQETVLGVPLDQVERVQQGDSDQELLRFPDLETGFRALKTQIQLDKQRGDTLGGFLEQYAPPHENATQSYLDFVSDRVGADPNTPLQDIETDQLARAITRFETGKEFEDLQGPKKKQVDAAPGVEQPPRENGMDLSQFFQQQGIQPTPPGRQRTLREFQREGGGLDVPEGPVTDIFRGIQRGAGAGVSLTGTGAEALFGESGVSDFLESTGKTIENMAGPRDREALERLGEFNWGDLATSDWWIHRAPEVAGTTLPLMVGGAIASIGGAQAAGAAGLGSLGASIVGGVAGTAFSRPLESMMEAGGAYRECEAQGGTDCNARAEKVFWGNMALAGMDVAEFALIASPFKGVGFLDEAVEAGRIGRSVTALTRTAGAGGLESGEEIFQELVQQGAAGERFSWSPQMQEAAAAGFLMGGAFQGSAEVAGAISRIPQRVQEEAPERIQEAINQNLSDVRDRIQAGELDVPESVDTDEFSMWQALDRTVEQIPEARQVVQPIIREQVQEAESIVLRNLAESSMELETPQFFGVDPEEAEGTLGELIGEDVFQQQAREVSAQRPDPDMELANLTNTLRGMVTQKTTQELQSTTEYLEGIQQLDTSEPTEQRVQNRLELARTALTMKQQFNIEDPARPARPEPEPQPPQTPQEPAEEEIGEEPTPTTPEEAQPAPAVQEEPEAPPQPAVEPEEAPEPSREPPQPATEPGEEAGAPSIDDVQDPDARQFIEQSGDPQFFLRQIQNDEQFQRTGIPTFAVDPDETVTLFRAATPSEVAEVREGQVPEQTLFEGATSSEARAREVFMEQEGHNALLRLETNRGSLEISGPVEDLDFDFNENVGPDAVESIEVIGTEETEGTEARRGELDLPTGADLAEERENLPDVRSQEIVFGVEEEMVAGEEEVPFRWGVMEATDIRTSEMPEGQFADSLQNRNESATKRDALREKFRSEKAFKPSMLEEDALINEGAATIDPESSTPIAGHLRSEMLRELYQTNHPNAQRYREHIMEVAERKGIPIEQAQLIENPVLVRVASRDITPQEAVDAARASNEATVSHPGGAEKAITWAARINDEFLRDLTRGSDGQWDIQANEGFINHLKRDVIPAAEQDPLFDSEGNTTVEGELTITNMLMAKIFGSTDLVRIKASERSDQLNINAIMSGLVRFLPELAEMEARGGGRYWDRAISGDIAEVVEAIDTVERSPQFGNITEYLDQTGLFPGSEGPSFTNFQMDMVRWMVRSGVRAYPNRVALPFENYIERVRSNPRDQTGMGFGDEEVEIPGREQIWADSVYAAELEHNLEHRPVLSANYNAWVAMDDYMAQFEFTDEGMQQFLEEARRATQIVEEGSQSDQSDRQIQASLNDEMDGMNIAMVENILNNKATGSLKEVFMEYALGQRPALPVGDDIDDGIMDAVNAAAEKAKMGELGEAIDFPEMTQEMEDIINSLQATEQIPESAIKDARLVIPELQERDLLTAVNLKTAVRLLNRIEGASQQAQAQEEVRRVDTMNIEVLLQKLDLEELGLGEQYQNVIHDELNRHYEMIKQTIDAMRRKGITMEQVGRLSQQLDIAPEGFMDLQVGSTLNAEEMYLLGSYVKQKTREATELKQRAQQGEDVAGQDKRAMNTALSLFEAWMRTGSEVARSLRTRQEVFDYRIAEFQEKRVNHPHIPYEDMQEMFNVDEKEYKQWLERRLQQRISEKAQEVLGFRVETRQWDEKYPEYWDDWRQLDVTDRAEVNEFVRKYLPQHVGDVVRWYWLNSVLSGPRTGFRNVIGGAMFSAQEAFAVQPGKPFFDMTLGMLRHPAQESQQVQEIMGGSGSDQYWTLKGFAAGLKPALTQATFAFQNGLDIDVGESVEYWRVEPSNHPAARIYGLPLRLMAFQDQFFRITNQQMVLHREAARQAHQKFPNDPQLYQQAVKDFIADPTLMEGDVLQKMEEMGARSVFQHDDVWLLWEELKEARAKLDQRALDYDSKVFKVAAWLGARLFEFANTSGQLFSRGLKATPVGWMTGVNKWIQSKKMLENMEQMTAEEIESAVDLYLDGRRDFSLATGSFLWFMGSALVFTLAMEGKITGPGPDDLEDRRLLWERGWQPWSFSFRNPISGQRVSFGYRYLEPFSPILGMAGVMWDEYRFGQGNPFDWQSIQRMSTRYSRFMMEKSYNYGLMSFGKALFSREGSWTDVVINPTTGMLPWVSALRTTRQAMDPVLRDPQTILEEYAELLPGTSFLVEPRRDQWGNPISVEKLPLNLDTFVVPRMTTPDEGVDTLQENIRRENNIGRYLRELKTASRLKHRDPREVDPSEFDLSEQHIAWAKGEFVASKVSQGRTMMEQGYIYQRLRDMLDSPQARQQAFFAIAAEEEGLLGDGIYDQTREMVWYTGDFLAEQIFSRLNKSPYNEDPDKAKAKLIQMMEFFRFTKWKDLPEDEIRRKKQQLWKNILELDQNRKTEIFAVAAQ